MTQSNVGVPKQSLGTRKNPQSDIPRTTRTSESSREVRSHPAVRQYTLLCLAALFLLAVCLAEDGLGWWCLVPALIGGIGLLAHWSLGPPLVIVSVTGLLLMTSRFRWGYPYWARHRVPILMDLVLCVAVLAYVMGHYRLLSLARHIFPADPRRAGGASAETAPRRSADLVTSWEMTLLVLALPLWMGLSVVAWGWLIDAAPYLGIPIEVWRGLLVAWAIVAALAVAMAVAGYVRQAAATPEESLLYLQDQVWRATRREQSHLNRWLVWARLRAGRRRGSS